jgi:catechol 2,3-dioxygenase-like lactoylglutathione lyase family enzyme
MERPSRVHATSVSISTPNPRELGAFYARLLGVDLAASEGPHSGEPATAGWAQLPPVEGRLSMTVNFEWDKHYVAPVWPTAEKAQQAMAHLDLWVDDLVEATAWALECGAAVHKHQPQESVRVMLDPHGHPFCLFT